MQNSRHFRLRLELYGEEQRAGPAIMRAAHKASNAKTGLSGFEDMIHTCFTQICILLDEPSLHFVVVGR